MIATLNSGTLTSPTLAFEGGSVEMVWDAGSTASSGTLLVERMSNLSGTGSTWTQLGFTGIGAGPAQITGAGTLVVTAGPCLLRMRAVSPVGGNILCELRRCFAGRVPED